MKITVEQFKEWVMIGVEKEIVKQRLDGEWEAGKVGSEEWRKCVDLFSASSGFVENNAGMWEIVDDPNGFNSAPFSDIVAYIEGLENQVNLQSLDEMSDDELYKLIYRLLEKRQYLAFRIYKIWYAK